ncbi:DUF3015 family protein [Candidatus Nitrospira bockiana]
MRTTWLGAGPLIVLLALSACTLRGTTQQITDTTQNTTVSTSGRSWFTEDGLVRQGEAAQAFAALNRDNLTQDMAAGGGEYLASLGVLLGVPDNEQAAFFQSAQRDYGRTGVEPAPADLLARLSRH